LLKNRSQCQGRGSPARREAADKIAHERETRQRDLFEAVLWN
jgi:hypothetical protein